MEVSLVTFSNYMLGSLQASLDNYVPGRKIVSLQNAPANVCKHKWIMTEDGIKYIVTFKKLSLTRNRVAYQMDKEIL